MRFLSRNIGLGIKLNLLVLVVLVLLLVSVVLLLTSNTQNLTEEIGGGAHCRRICHHGETTG